ncbi:MAG: TonB-dependent receptor [Psychroflexus sp.]
MKFLKQFLFILLAFGLSSITYAQRTEKAQELIRFINLLEKEYNVLFSYADDEIDNVIVPTKKKFSSLDENLRFLRETTPFNYKYHSDTNILIIPKSGFKMLCITIKDKLTQKGITNSFLKTDQFIFNSDSLGQFKIPINSAVINLYINANGYIPKQLEIDTRKKNDCPVFELSPFYEVLDEVLLRNFLTSGIQKFTSGVLEINYEDFGLLPGLVEPDVLLSLKSLPGITSRNESVSYINVRGGTHDQNLILWDGIKMYHTSHFFGMISAFNPYMTKKVKLVKNGTSSKFGDGVSSLIDMQTSDSINSTFKAEVGLNLINTDAIIEAPLNQKSSIEFSFRKSINSLWESPTYDRYFDKTFQNTEVTIQESPTAQQNNDFSFYDASLNYKNQLSRNDYLKANFFYSHDEFSLNRFEIERNRVNIRSSNLNQSNAAGGIYYNRNWTKTTKTQIQLYASRYNQNSINADFLDKQRLEQINEVREIGIKLNLQTKLNKNIAFEGGYQLNETGILNSERIDNPGFFRETQNSIITNSIYSQINYQSENSRLNLQLGGRLNHFSKFEKVTIEPRFNLSYKLIGDLFLELLGEEKSQVTSQVIDLQTDFLGVESRRWVLSNLNNRPIIQSQQVSTGFNYIKPSWFINVDLFYKKVEGITTEGQGFQNQFRFAQDHGNYEVKGIDFLINKNLNQFSSWISYSLSENSYEFESLEPSTFQNNLDIRHVVSTGLTYEQNGLKLSAGFNWHSGATVTIPSDDQSQNPQEILYQAPNSERLSDYFRLDFSSTYTFSIFKNIQTLAGFSMWNVLGSSNVYNQFYWLDENQNIQNFKQKGLGFTPNFVFRLKF